MKRYFLISVLLISALLGAAKAYLDYRLPIELDKIIKTEKIPLTYAEAYLTPLGALTIKNANFSTIPLTVETLTVHQAYQFYDLNSLPSFMRLTAQKIQIPISDQSTAPPPLWNILGYADYYLSSRELRTLGYTTLHAELDISPQQTPENQLLVNGFFNIVQGGKFILTAELEAVPPPAKWTNTTFLEVTVKKLTLSYTDDKFVKQVFSFLAQRNKVTVEQLKQSLATKIVTDLRQTGLAFDRSVLTSLQKFIQNPDTLTVRLEPSVPLNFKQLERLPPTTLLKSLGLRMEMQAIE